MPIRIDYSKPVETREGRPVRILCTDSKNPKYPVVGLVTDLNGVEHKYDWTREGLLIAGEFNQEDLMNAGEPE